MKNLILSLFSFLICLLFAEAALRIGPEKKMSKWDDRPIFYFRDMQSMQSHKYNPIKPKDVFRIAVIGDSFTFAPYMQFTDTFVAKLEQMLNLNSGKTEVINYGVPAYSTSHEVAVAKKAIEEQADLVLLQITLNDPEFKAHRPSAIGEQRKKDDPFGPYRKPDTFLGKFKIYNFVMSKLHNNKSHKAYADYFLDLFKHKKHYPLFERSMTELVKNVKGANTKIVAVVFPLFGLAMDETYPFYSIHKKVNTLLNKLEVNNLDLSDTYKGIPLERLQVLPGVDRHPNEIAHRLAAEKIYLWLEENKLLPDNIQIKDKFATRLGINEQRRYSK